MLDTLLFDGWGSLVRAFLMCLLAYPFLILLLRLFGKRALTKINIFDFIITITYGATLGSVLTSDIVSFAEAAVILFMLTLLQFIVAKLTTNFSAFADFIKASPAFLYSDGQLNVQQMQKHQIRIEDLHAKLRKQGMSSLEKVEAIVLEGDGSISIIKKEEGSSKEALQNIPRANGKS